MSQILHFVPKRTQIQHDARAYLFNKVGPNSETRISNSNKPSNIIIQFAVSFTYSQ